MGMDNTMNAYDTLINEAAKLAETAATLLDEMFESRKNGNKEEAKSAWEKQISFDNQAYSPIDGGKVICEATKCARFSTGGFNDFFQFRFYFLPDGEKWRKSFSKAKAVKALS
jgi:hypothetical protein